MENKVRNKVGRSKSMPCFVANPELSQHIVLGTWWLKISKVFDFNKVHFCNKLSANQ